MPVDGLRSLYVQTHDFEKAAAFWKALGFEHFLDLGGTSGGFRSAAAGGGTYVFLQQVDTGEPLTIEPYFNIAGSIDVDDAGVEVVTPLEATHWDTRIMEVRDPDGRVWKLEDAGQQFPDYG